MGGKILRDSLSKEWDLGLGSGKALQKLCLKDKRNKLGMKGRRSPSGRKNISSVLAEGLGGGA